MQDFVPDTCTHMPGIGTRCDLLRIYLFRIFLLRNRRRCRLRFAGITLLLLLPHVPFAAEAPASESERLLLEASQLRADLVALEESTQHPAAETLVVWVGVAAAPEFTLERITLQVDGGDVVSRAYTDKAFDALRRGGVDRLVVGGIRPGRHTLEAVCSGRLADGQPFSRNTRIDFDQGTQASLVQLQAAGTEMPALRATLVRH